MGTYALEWLQLLLRWGHVVVAIAWVGASFYFVFLDHSLRPPKDEVLRDQGVSGELWAVHGGGFYHAQKYAVAPRHLPAGLHWFYWESYATWLTGFALFSVTYLWQAQVFLIDPRVHAWPTTLAAAATAVAFLAVFWLAYDLICRTLGQRAQGDRWVGACVVGLVVVAAWLAAAWFAPRAAFLLVGAMLATAMSANVLFWIIPGQRAVLAQMRAGESVDPAHGQRAKQRSVHNTYFTLPVLVAMLSNHHGFLLSAPQPWLALVLLMAAGALIRHFFVARHKALVEGRPLHWPSLIAAGSLLVGLAVWLKPMPAPSTDEPRGAVIFDQVQQLVSTRCLTCHNAVVASKGVQLHTPALIQQHAQQIYQQAAVLKTMPLNNATQITAAERALLARWFEGGAPGPGAPSQ